MEKKHCHFWLSNKNRFCANTLLNGSPFCGNHKPRSEGQWIPCPVDPSHSVLKENLQGHVGKCPLLKRVQTLSGQPFYQKGINAGTEQEKGEAPVTSEMKRNAVRQMSVMEFRELIRKIDSVHDLIFKDISDSYRMPEDCKIWIKRAEDRKLPFQEKHAMQQASIVGNLELFGVLKNSAEREEHNGERVCRNNDCYCVPAVIEFGAGRGYLTQMLADCYGIERVYLVERKAYKLKADRSLQQKESMKLERLRIDIEDLDLNAVESLRGVPYLAIGKHLCGPATDLTLRCCLSKQSDQDTAEGCMGNDHLEGLAIATCCHHLCQWKHYINKPFMSGLGITKEQFHAITWFTSWAVDADHSSDLPDITNSSLHTQSIEEEQCGGDGNDVEAVVRSMKAAERAALGFKCKQIIDVGRMMWIKESGLDSRFVKYVPSSISPENHLLIGRKEKFDGRLKRGRSVRVGQLLRNKDSILSDNF